MLQVGSDSYSAYCMDIVLVEKFIQEMVPPAGNIAIRTAFEKMRSSPEERVMTVGNFLGVLQRDLYSANENVQANAGTCLIAGVMISFASEDRILKEIIMDPYLSRGAKQRGDNVINFFGKKAERL